ncbi:MAG TPA: hypothetical protein VFY65_11715 [Longimicrobium sp.]|nr:hypothetical protein [Longimicrobium sp.]
MIPSAEKRRLFRGFLLAATVYVIGYVLLWALVYRHGWTHGTRIHIAYAISAALCLAFVGVAGRLALTARTTPVLEVAAVSAAALFAAGVVRTALAAVGMREFLLWDHDSVLLDSILGEALFSFTAMIPAAFIVICSRAIFGRGQRRSP